jgi:hypothetical protein
MNGSSPKMSAKVRQALQPRSSPGTRHRAPDQPRHGTAQDRQRQAAAGRSGDARKRHRSSSDGFFVPAFCSKPLIERQLGGSLAKYRESGHFLLSGATEQAALRYAGFN